MKSVTKKIGLRAHNLFMTRQLTCSESVFSVINGALGGELSDPMAIRIASGLSEGMGGAGCVCGALSGGILAIGLFLGRSGPGLGNGREVAAASRQLHDAFGKAFNATCCRVLMKRTDRGSKDHFHGCAKKTAMAAQSAARLILEARPHLLNRVDHIWLDRTDSRLSAHIKRVSGMFQSSHHG